ARRARGLPLLVERRGTRGRRQAPRGPGPLGARGRTSRVSQQPPERSGFLRDLPTLIGAVAVALAIRTFLVQPFYVPSDSMLPTLLVGDPVFVNNFLFGAGRTGTSPRFPAVRDPERGEVLVFQFARGPNGTIFPADQRPDLPRDAFVKRLI